MRVLVVRAAEAADRTARSLEAAGHDPVLAPATSIVPTGAGPPSGGFDAVLATSAHAFLSLGPGFDALHRRPAFVVGRATAEAARRAGFLDTRIAAGEAASLVALLRLTLPGAPRLLYLAGRDRKPLVEQVLAESGCRIEPVVTYAAEPVEHWPDAIVADLEAAQVRAALHFSRRSAGLALGLARRHDVLAAFLALQHVCLSEDVATPLRAGGVAHPRVARRPEEAALIERLSAGDP